MKRIKAPILGGVLAALLFSLLAAPAALASHGQISLFEDDVALGNNSGATLQELRHLGVDMVRVGVHWSYIAPNPTSRRTPRFNGADPNAYPAGAWAPLDTIAREAAADGLKLLFVPTGFAPYWAQGPNPRRYGDTYKVDQAFMPNARMYGQFVRALATRYSGRFTPRGSLSRLPRVSYWELYNEPNFGEDIAPQAIDKSRVLYSPIVYRALLNAGWSALHATGHGRDTILIGALAARGIQGPPNRHAPQGYPGTLGETKPLAFIRALYCVDNSYRQYRGAAAAIRSCPTTARASARFRAQNPALFNAGGFSDHPYPVNQPPTQAYSNDPDFTDFSELPRLASMLDRIQRIYRSGKRFPIWNTEYSYITDPPNRSKPGAARRGQHYVSPATAANYINWTEYLSWENPRIVSTMQYLLYDPNPVVGTPEYGGFASGLLFYRTVLGGGPKAAYFAYRLPIFMPRTSTRLGNTLQVWGDVRPAPFAVADGDGTQFVQIQFQQSPRSQWITEKTVPVTDRHGYFETPVAFPSSGFVRIAWTYPLDPSLASNLVTPTQMGVGPNGYVEPLAQATTSRSVKIKLT